MGEQDPQGLLCPPGMVSVLSPGSGVSAESNNGSWGLGEAKVI